MEQAPNLAGTRILLLLLSSLLLNFYLYYHIVVSSNPKAEAELVWSQGAAAEAEAVAALTCSGHGRAFLDSLVVDGVPKCECNTCYAGPDCSQLVPDCPANVDESALLYKLCLCLFQLFLEYFFIRSNFKGVFRI